MNDLRLARALSAAGHPLVLIPLTVALTTGSLRAAAIIAATMTLPLAAFIAAQVRRGSWSDFDVSRRDQRSGLYAVVAVFLALGAVTLYLTGASPRMMRGLAATAVMLAVALLGNRILKTSMHLMFAAYCAVLVIRFYPWSALLVVPFVMAIAWSRLRLGRHTLAEVIVGAILGTLTGLYVVVF